MANRHPSAVKRNRQNEKRRLRNRQVRSEVRTEIRKVREALASGNAETAEAQLPRTLKVLTKAGTKGVIHRNAVSRRVSRLSRQVAALKAAG